MPLRPTRLAAPAALLVALIAWPASPAFAADVFADDFEQPTVNVWQPAGGAFTRVSDGASTVFAQSDGTRDATVLTAAGLAHPAAGAAVELTARVRRTGGSPPPGGRIGVVARAAHHNNHYYAVLRDGTVEIGTRLWGTVTPLASQAIAGAEDQWFTVTLRVGGGTVTGTAVAAGGGTATVTAADPGGAGFGDRVGLWTERVAGAFDDVRFTDDAPAQPVDPTAPCPLDVRFTVVAQWPGTFQGQFALTNSGAAPVGPGWRIAWRFPGGHTVTTAFSVGSWYQRGDTVTATNPVWWATVPPGGTVSFGFTATGQGTAYPPAEVTVNGIPCAPAP